MKKRILFITTKRDNYHNTIRDEFLNIGYDVKMIFDYPRNFFIRVYTFIFKKKWDKVVKNYYKKKYYQLKDLRYDYIIVLRGHRLPTDFLLKIKNNNKNAIFIMYQWDSLINHDYRYLIPYFDHVYSFDGKDVEDNDDLSYLPLFYSDRFVVKKKYDVCFIGGNHGDRVELLEKIEDMFKRNGITFYFYLYQSLPLMIRNILLREKGNFQNKRFFKYVRLPERKVSKIMANSKIVLDLNSPTQTGLTIRQIETIGMGLKTITTNDRIRKEKIYNNEQFCLIDRQNLDENKIVNFCKKGVDNPIPFAKSYHISSWVKKLLNIEKS